MSKSFILHNNFIPYNYSLLEFLTNAHKRQHLLPLSASIAVCQNTEQVLFKWLVVVQWGMVGTHVLLV